MNNENKTPKGWVSCWKGRDPDGPVVFSGNVQVTVDVLKSWLEQPLDSYGNVSLDLVLFHNDSNNPKAPTYKGQIKVDDYNKGKQQQAPAQSAPLPTAHGNSDLPDYDDMPF